MTTKKSNDSIDSYADRAAGGEVGKDYDTSKDRGADLAWSVERKTAGLAKEAGHRIQEAAHSVGTHVQEAARAVGDRVQEVAHQVSDKAKELAGKAEETVRPARSRSRTETAASHQK